MIESIRTSSKVQFIFFIFVLLIVTYLSIYLNIPVLRQVLGFVFLTFIPGLIILNVLKLDKLGLTEKVILSVSLSISFDMFFGLFVNFVYPLFGYSKPLTTNSLLISFSVIILLLSFVACLINPRVSFVEKSKLNLNTREKFSLLLPAFFPLLSILGTNVMNATNNNIILIVLLLLIPAYAIFIAVEHKRFTDKTYPLLIFFISISLLLLHAMRSNYIMGVDTHEEYYLFQLVFQAGHWTASGGAPLDACLSISLLPTIYQSYLDINPEYLFKLLYPLLVSILPLIVYVISKKYVRSFYAFLASLFFMAQFTFLWTTADARTNLAILFFSLVIMVLFHNGLSNLEKSILFIIFAASCIVSHYSSTYLFFFVFLLAWMGTKIIFSVMLRGNKPRNSPDNLVLENHSQDLSPRDWIVSGKTNTFGTNRNIFQFIFQPYITLPALASFFIMIFFWYGQVSPGALNSAIGFVQQTLLNLNKFFVLESRGGVVASIMGAGILAKGTPALISFIFSWLTVGLIGIGVLGTMIMYKRMILAPNALNEKLDFLRGKIDIEFFVISLSCSVILFLSVALPYVLKGYALDRTYFQMVTVLSIFFVIGGLMVAKLFRSPKTYLAVLMVLIPYLICQTGIIYQVFNSPQDIVLNSDGSDYRILYTHDQESYCATWLKENMVNGSNVYSDFYGDWRLLSQSLINPIYLKSLIQSVDSNQPINNGYIFLRYTGVVDKELLDDVNQPHYLAEYQNEFNQESLIYSNGGSEVWK